jgi:3-isopropylmalate dehydrogenase
MINTGTGSTRRASNRSGGIPHVVGVLHGEGIGPEVIAATLEVLAETARIHDLSLDLREGPQVPPDPALSDEVAAFFETTFAAGGPVLCGPAGGRFVYELRRHFDLYYKLVPLRPLPHCLDLGPLKPERCAGADVLLVRENTSGLYFGEWGHAVVDGIDHAYHRFGYQREEVGAPRARPSAVAACAPW